LCDACVRYHVLLVQDPDAHEEWGTFTGSFWLVWVYSMGEVKMRAC